MAKRKAALPLRSKVNAAMKAAYVALYAQLGRQRPAWGTEASAPLDAWTTAQVLDHHPDRQVGRAPHDVDDAERDRDEPRRRWHGHRGCHRQTAVLLLHPAMLGR